MIEQLIQYDIQLFLWLNSQHTAYWDPIMWFISGKLQWLPLYLGLLAYIIYRYKKESIPIILAIILCITLADQLGVKAFKEVFQRLRPSHNPDLEGIIHLVNNYKGGAYSFVSNHAANAFALASFLALLFRNRLFSISILFWASLVAYSRIYLGVHYPGDILGGALLGGGIGSALFFIYQKLINTPLLSGLKAD